VAVTIASTHCAYPRRDGQAALKDWIKALRKADPVP